jgi:hypothetical protein
VQKEPTVLTDHSQKRSERIQLMLDEVELEAIDTWRFANRLPSRAAAIRELIKRGLLNRELAPPATKDAKTSDFTVMPGPLEDG